MQLRGVLMILFMSLCTAHGLSCYSCATTDPKSCTDTITCIFGFDRCSSVSVLGVLTKTCMISSACVSPISCCEGDLCNGAIPTDPTTIATGPTTKPTGPTTKPTGPTTIPTGPSCCKENLCNGSVVTGPSGVLLLVSSSIIMRFI
ncbi:lymphocyte antigen 6G-like [Betta splendens]|uniref:Lymphocyte antigen 6G-like n=1 Tax=Betta splendens TaxID=158456 RepID=A0A6P7NN87_BETSP|nr:lymphocyte antigen 6G-like [Betta splendens]